MKKLGLIGGTGPESTLIYYRDIVRAVHNKTGAYPELTIENVDCELCGAFMASGDSDALTEYLLGALSRLAAADCDFAALTANTLHAVFDRLAPRSPLPLISIIGTACDEAVRRGHRRIGLLGTIFTMESEFFTEPFRRAGIEVFTPDAPTRKLVHDRIFGELELGVVKPETVAELVSVIAEMKAEHGIEALALGCTELPLALNDGNCPVPCLDTMAIHIDKLVDGILG